MRQRNYVDSVLRVFGKEREEGKKQYLGSAERRK